MDKQRLGAGRVAFLAHLESIRRDIEAGWTMKAVYDTQGEKLGITYSQFTRYVARFVKEKPSSKTRQGETRETHVTSQSNGYPHVLNNTSQSPQKSHPLFEATPPPDQTLF